MWVLGFRAGVLGSRRVQDLELKLEGLRYKDGVYIEGSITCVDM